MNISMLEHKHSRWWHDLCNLCDVGNHPNWFDSRIKWTLGDGKSVRFWDDR